MRYRESREDHVMSDIKAGDRFMFVGIDNDTDRMPITVQSITIFGEVYFTYATMIGGRDSNIKYSEALLMIEQGIWQELV